MTRIVVALIVLIAVVPAVAQEEPDCSEWSIKGLQLGITLDEAQASGRNFKEVKKFRDPLGYRRYLWQAPGRPEKIDLHVDVAVDPPVVIGVMTTIPTADIEPAKYLEQTIERWGKPRKRSGQGAFTLYTFGEIGCDVSARVSIMNAYHPVGVWLAVNSISGRDEFARRKRESKAAPEGASAGSEGAGDDR